VLRARYAELGPQGSEYFDGLFKKCRNGKHEAQRVLTLLHAYCMRRAASRAACTAGKRSPTKMPMIAITTNNSTKVNPRRKSREKVSVIFKTPRYKWRKLARTCVKLMIKIHARNAYESLSKQISLSICPSPTQELPELT